MYGTFPPKVPWKSPSPVDSFIGLEALKTPSFTINFFFSAFASNFLLWTERLIGRCVQQQLQVRQLGVVGAAPGRVHVFLPFKQYLCFIKACIISLHFPESCEYCWAVLLQ